MSYVAWLFPPCVFIHGQCNHSTSVLMPSRAGYEGKLGEGGKLWRWNGYFVEFCLLSQSLVGLYCYVVAMEKNTGSCAIKLSRKRHFQEFFRVKKQTANCRIHEVLRSTTHPFQPSILERSYSFYGSCEARALSPNYFCKQICFLMNGGGKQNRYLRMECVILGTDVVGVLSPISLTDNSLNKWKQVKCYLIFVKY